MAFTSSDLSTIDAAIATGALRVKFADGREVMYQTGADLLKARALIQAEVNAASATPPQRMTRVVHVRG
jgi:hypothetical protein